MTDPGRPSGLSLRAIVGCGAAVVAVCLGLALTFAIASLERLGDQSERLLASGVNTTRLIEQLADRITDVERIARQYTVVGSPNLLQIYRDRRQALIDTLGDLQSRDDVAALGPALAELQILLERIETSMSQTPSGIGDPSVFSAMNEVAQRARDVAQVRFDSELARLQRRVEQVRTALIALTVAVVAAALLAALAFARLVNRPMREITASIDHLGRAELDSPIRVSGPRDLQAIGTSLDWLRRRIRDLEAQKSTFVRHMSHELKSPLANIRAGIDLLSEAPAADQDTQEIAEIVERNATRLQRQIDDLLAYAGWQDAQPPQQPSAVRLHDLIGKSVEDQAFEARSRGVQVEASLQPVTITADETQIRAIVDNLVGNAIKYSPDGGRVDVRLVRQGGDALFDVEDHGPGIPADLRERVFEPFFRGPGASAFAGTGIGLSLASAAARAHGGSIDILDAPQGTHMRAVLPLEPAD